MESTTRVARIEAIISSLSRTVNGSSNSNPEATPARVLSSHRRANGILMIYFLTPLKSVIRSTFALCNRARLVDLSGDIKDRTTTLELRGRLKITAHLAFVHQPSRADHRRALLRIRGSQ
jgi:hypothetical protein